MIRRTVGAAWLVAAAIALTSPVLAQMSVVDSKHNLSSSAGANQMVDRSTNENQVCVFCHTAHQAAPAAPLWNHSLSTVASYGVYSSPTLDASDIADIGGTGDVSLLCMSCHDGTVAVNSLGNPPNDINANPTMGTGHELDASGRILASVASNMGTSLANDHPVNFTYSAALATADPGLVTPASTAYVDAAHTVPLFNGKLECASCHNPHDNTYVPFLTKSNAGSQLCLTCHRK